MIHIDDKLLLERLRHYAGPIEFHLTTALNAKSIWIELAAGETVNQPMLGMRIDDDAEKQRDKIQHAVNAIGKDFDVVRIKVEAAPSNKNLPQSNASASDAPSDCYFEHHVALQITPTTNLEELRESVAKFHGHLSRNAFKEKTEASNESRFVTQRFHRMGQNEADDKLDELLAFLKSEGFDTHGVEREYNIFDSALYLDEGWM